MGSSPLETTLILDTTAEELGSVVTPPDQVAEDAPEPDSDGGSQDGSTADQVATLPPCAQCGEPVAGARRKYCGPECQTAARKARKAAQKRSTATAAPSDKAPAPALEEEPAEAELAAAATAPAEPLPAPETPPARLDLSRKGKGPAAAALLNKGPVVVPPGAGSKPRRAADSGKMSIGDVIQGCTKDLKRCAAALASTPAKRKANRTQIYRLSKIVSELQQLAST